MHCGLHGYKNWSVVCLNEILNAILNAIFCGAFFFVSETFWKMGQMFIRLNSDQILTNYTY